jgi:para-nitrobenzyl esterase
MHSHLVRVRRVFAATALSLAIVGCGGGGGGSDSPATSSGSSSYAISKDAKVTVAGGELQGTNLSSGARAFLGVPFMAPPVGNLRWKAPQAVSAWTGTRLAQSLPPVAIFSSAAVTLAGMTTPWTTSEDALYLNMWVPPEAKASAGKLPVVVWMHGNNGDASQTRYGGEQLAKKGVILVLPQRRQGVFGGLALSELSAEKENNGASGNFDMLDMIQSLKWVRDNIAKFGGDPDNVTLAGQSMGSIFASKLQASPLAKGLFKRIFAESGTNFNGTGTSTSATPLASIEATGANLLAKFGTVTGTTAASNVAALRAKSTAEILLVGTGMFSNATNDYVMPDIPQNLFLAGKQNDVPIYVGWCRDESIFGALSSVMNPADVVTNLATYKTKLSAKFGTDADTVFNLYPAFNDKDAVSQALRLNNDYEFGKQMVSWARLQKTKGTSPAYLFTFYRGNSTGEGAKHGRDVNYWFGNLTAAYGDNSYPYTTAADYELSERMMDSLVSWATTGNPSTPEVKVPEYNQNDQKVVGFDVGGISSVPISAGIDWFIKNAAKY